MPRRLPPNLNCKIWTELLPEEAGRDRGRHIYLFRNIQTNQVLYSLQPRVVQRTLRQLPFIGKKSVPPSVRQDHWAPFCRVGPFPSSKQGLGALKKLREFRKLHELSWDETNPEWRKHGKKALIKRIMDQRANSVADLAQVLSIQESQAEFMEEKTKERTAQQEQFLERRWAQLEALAKSIDEGAIAQLEKKIRDCKSVLGESKDNEAEVARLNEAMATHRRKIRELLWAQHMVQDRDKKQAFIEQRHAAFVEELNQKRVELTAQGKIAEADAIRAPPMPENKIRTSVLPKALKTLPSPYAIDTIEVHWADLQDAEFAESWPGAAVHDTLQAVVQKRELGFVTEQEVADRLADIKADRERAAKKVLEEQEAARLRLVEEAAARRAEYERKAGQRRAGIWKIIPSLRNPFRRAAT